MPLYEVDASGRSTSVRARLRRNSTVSSDGGSVAQHRGDGEWPFGDVGKVVQRPGRELRSAVRRSGHVPRWMTFEGHQRADRRGLGVDSAGCGDEPPRQGGGLGRPGPLARSQTCACGRPLVANWPLQVRTRTSRRLACQIRSARASHRHALILGSQSCRGDHASRCRLRCASELASLPRIPEVRAAGGL